MDPVNGVILKQLLRVTGSIHWSADRRPEEICLRNSEPSLGLMVNFCYQHLAFDVEMDLGLDCVANYDLIGLLKLEIKKSFSVPLTLSNREIGEWKDILIQC